jgi:hypothetical protein
MSLEVLSTAAAVGTFVVIAAGTVAALVQLTHLRSGNQLQSFIDLGHQLQQLAPNIGFVYHELPRKMEDPAFRRQAGAFADVEQHPELRVALFLDQFGLLVKMKLMPERFLMEYGGGAAAFAKCWTNIEDVIALRRRELPNAYQNFEFLAVRARKWLDRFPNGTYPSNEPRIPIAGRGPCDDPSRLTRP